MFDFKCNKGHISRAVFTGSMDDIIAELSMGVSVLYGSLKKQDEEEAEKFKKHFATVIFHDAMIADEPVIFDEKLVDQLMEDDDYHYEVKSRKVSKKEDRHSDAVEFLKMLANACERKLRDADDDDDEDN